MTNQARGANEWNETYGGMGAVAQTQLIQLPLHLLDPWKGEDGKSQPFDPYSPAKLQRLADNIAKNGVIEPICVRPKPDGRFQIIAGHNRVEGSKLAGLKVIPALLRQLDDAMAKDLMIDSNLQHRDTILPCERARAYAELMENLRHRGQRTDLTSDNDCPKSGGAWSHQIIADRYGVSPTSVKQHLRLLKLTEHWQEMVDNAAREKEEQDPKILVMTFVAGYELSFLSTAEQLLLLSVVHDLGKAPTPGQAKKLHKASTQSPLNQEVILEILVKKDVSAEPTTVQLPATRIRSFFPPNITPEAMEAAIYEALLAYRQRLESEVSDADE